LIISLLTRLLFAAYFLEAGLILIVAPWSAFWEQNSFGAIPTVAPLLASPFIRGGVSGIGAVTALAGLAELGAAFVSRRPPEESPERTA